MKIVMSLGALMFSLFMTAQQPEPVMEKAGDQVKATYFHENGKIAQVGFYQDGKLHGEWKMYNEEGKKLAMGQYNEGVRTGKWFFWEADGLKEVDYEQNKIARVVKWNQGEAVVVNE